VLEIAQLLTEQVPVDGIGVVEIVRPFLLVREVAGVLVVGVLGDDHDLLFELARDRVDYGGFSGTGTACYSYD